jgi:hypothetical protein
VTASLVVTEILMSCDPLFVALLVVALASGPALACSRRAASVRRRVPGHPHAPDALRQGTSKEKEEVES